MKNRLDRVCSHFAMGLYYNRKGFVLGGDCDVFGGENDVEPMRAIRVIAFLGKNSDLSQRITSLLATPEFELLFLESDIDLQEILRIETNLILVSLIRQFKDNYRIAFAISKIAGEKAIPLLTITDKSLPYDMIPGLNLPLDMRCDYIVYPFDTEEFLVKVRQLITLWNE